MGTGVDIQPRFEINGWDWCSSHAGLRADDLPYRRLRPMVIGLRRNLTGARGEQVCAISLTGWLRLTALVTWGKCFVSNKTVAPTLDWVTVRKVYLTHADNTTPLIG